MASRDVVQAINVGAYADGVRSPGFRSLPDRRATMQLSLVNGRFNQKVHGDPGPA